MSAAPQLTVSAWTVKPEAPDEGGEPLYFAILDATGREVANTCGGAFPTEVERQHANAIAAAPLMLAAIEGMIQALNAQPIDVFPMPRNMRAAADQLVLARGKARGEA